MDSSEERIGLNGAAAVLDVPTEAVRRFVEEGRLRAERGEDGAFVFSLGEVVGLARGLGAEAAEEEIFEGEVMGMSLPVTPGSPPSRSSATSASCSRDRTTRPASKSAPAR
jgi:hypothetical protein